MDKFESVVSTGRRIIDRSNSSIKTLKKFLKCHPYMLRIPNFFPGHIEASKHKRIEFIKVMLKYGLDLNLKYSENGRTILHYFAISVNASSSVDFLLENGADPNSIDFGGRTPLHMCTSPIIASKLIKYGALIDVKNYNGQTPIEHHINCGRETISMYLYKMGSLINQNELNKLLSICDNVANCRYLIERGANPNATIYKQVESPLIRAIYDKQIEKVKLFFDMGATLNLNSEGQEKLLDCFSGNVTMFRLLIQNGLSPLIYGRPSVEVFLDGSLDCAQEYVRLLNQEQLCVLVYESLRTHNRRHTNIHRFNMVAPFLRVNAVFENGDTILHAACRNRVHAIVKSLAKIGHDDRDIFGRTPLHHTTCILCFNELIQYCDVNAQDAIGRTFLHYIDYRHEIKAEDLIKHGAKAEIKDVLGRMGFDVHKVRLIREYRFYIFTSQTGKYLYRDIHEYVKSFVLDM